MSAAKMTAIPTDKGLAVTDFIQWVHTGSAADMLRSYDFKSQGARLGIKKLACVIIDNSRNDNSLTITVGNGIYGFNVLPGMTGVFPLVTHDLSVIDVVCSGTGLTRVCFLDYRESYFQYSSTEIAQVVSDTGLKQVMQDIGGLSPVLGTYDQTANDTLSDIRASVKPPAQCADSGNTSAARLDGATLLETLPAGNYGERFIQNNGSDMIAITRDGKNFVLLDTTGKDMSPGGSILMQTYSGPVMIYGTVNSRYTVFQGVK